jgi:hypothetical protein
MADSLNIHLSELRITLQCPISCETLFTIHLLFWEVNTCGVYSNLYGTLSYSLKTVAAMASEHWIEVSVLSKVVSVAAGKACWQMFCSSFRAAISISTAIAAVVFSCMFIDPA